MTTGTGALTDECPNDCGDHCGNPAWTREDDWARIDRLKPLAEHLRVGHDVLPEHRRYQSTWLHIALLADEWFAARAGGQQTQAEAALDEAEARLSEAEADLDRVRARLWKLAAVAGHVPHESDNDATAELVIGQALTSLPERAPTQAEQAVERVRVAGIRQVLAEHFVYWYPGSRIDMGLGPIPGRWQCLCSLRFESQAAGVDHLAQVLADEAQR